MVCEAEQQWQALVLWFPGGLSQVEEHALCMLSVLRVGWPEGYFRTRGCKQRGTVKRQHTYVQTIRALICVNHSQFSLNTVQSEFSTIWNRKKTPRSKIFLWMLSFLLKWNLILTIWDRRVFFVTYFFSLIPHSEICFHFTIHVFCLKHWKQTDDDRSEKQLRGLKPGSLFVSIKKTLGHFCVHTIAFQYEACLLED